MSLLHPVITAQEMQKIEERASLQGLSARDLMLQAGKEIARLVQVYTLPCTVVLLIGKGNNGGDTYVAGRYLLQAGFSVLAYQFFPSNISSPLCQEQGELFKAHGGQIHLISSVEDLVFPQQGILLDGLLGTGLKPSLDPYLLKIISTVNTAAHTQCLPIFAIDIPSGLHATTGLVEKEAIHATYTIFLGFPKRGFFLEQGWDHVGKLLYADLGLAAYPVEATAYISEGIKELLPPLNRSRHKYQAGYLMVFAGSQGMGGAAALSTLAALRSGAGVVRLFHPQEMEKESLAPEVLKSPWNLETLHQIAQEKERASALLLGPGLGRSSQVEKLLSFLLKDSCLPTLFDADALYFLAQNPTWELPTASILTPHQGEMERLLKEKRAFHSHEAWLSLCQEYMEKKKTILVLKGAPTFILSPDRLPYIIPRGDPGMATAGTGDVLAGMIASFLAQGVFPLQAALLGTTLQALAGEKAAEKKSSYGMIASDLIAFLPEVLLSLASPLVTFS